MMPTLQGAPDVSHLGATDFPMTFEANLVDHPRPERVSYHWSSPDECLEIQNPTMRMTEVLAHSLPGYDRLQLSVTADVGGRTLSSSLGATYGTNDYPGVAIRLTVPKVVFVNDGDTGDSTAFLDKVEFTPSATREEMYEIVDNDPPLTAVQSRHK